MISRIQLIVGLLALSVAMPARAQFSEAEAAPAAAPARLVPALPLFWYRSGDNGALHIPALLTFSHWHHDPATGDDKGAIVGPLFGWKKSSVDGATKNWGGGLFPLLWLGRNEHKHRLVLAPIFTLFRDDARHSYTTSLGPLYLHRRAEGKGFDAGAFPLLFFGKANHGSYAGLLPLFFYRHNASGTTAVVGPGYGYSGSRGWAFGIAPLAHFGHLGDNEHQVLFPPLFIRTANAKKQQSMVLFGPLFHAQSGSRELDMIVPLLYFWRDQKNALLLSPLIGWRKSEAAEHLVIGPYIYKRDAATQSRTHFLFPLALVHDQPDYHVRAQIPFFWRIRNGSLTSTLLFPLYLHQRSPTYSADSLFPIFWHSRKGDTRTDIVGPLFVQKSDNGDRAAALFPLFVYRKRVEAGQSRSFAAGLPGFYWQQRSVDQSHLLIAGPLFSSKRGSDYVAGLVPLAFAWRSGDTSSVLAPLFFNRRNHQDHSSLTVLLPFYFGRDSKGGGQLGLPPLLFSRWHPSGYSTTVLFPLFVLNGRPDGSRLLTPLFGYSRYKAGHWFYFGPLYSRRDEKRSATALWPLFCFSKNQEDQTHMHFVLPFYFDRQAKQEERLTAFSPLFWRYQDIERRVFAAPLFVDNNNYFEARTTTFFPFFVRHHSRVDNTVAWALPPLLTWWRKTYGESGKTDVVIFPLFWRFGGSQQSTTVLAPLFWDFKRGDQRTTVFFPLYARWVRNDGTYQLIGNTYVSRGHGPKEGAWYVNFIPLVDFGHPRKGDLEWNVAEGLFGYARKGRQRTLKLFWLLEIPLSPAPSSSLTWFSNTPPEQRPIF